MFQLSNDQLVRMGLTRFSRRLSAFVDKSVRTTKPLSHEEVQQAVFSCYKNAHRAGFDSEADMALYVISRLCFPERAQELDSFVGNTQMRVDERRFQLNADLARFNFMGFGALEADPLGSEY